MGICTKQTYNDRFFDCFLKVHISLPRYVEGWEQVANEPHKDSHIISHYLRSVEITKSPHQYLGGGKQAHYCI